VEDQPISERRTMRLSVIKQTNAEDISVVVVEAITEVAEVEITMKILAVAEAEEAIKEAKTIMEVEKAAEVEGTTMMEVSPTAEVVVGAVEDSKAAIIMAKKVIIVSPTLLLVASVNMEKEVEEEIMEAVNHGSTRNPNGMTSLTISEIV